MDLPSYEELSARFRYLPESGQFHRRKDGRLIQGKKKKGYLHMRHGNKTLRAHRIAWLLTTGEWPKGQIDHINGDKADNRIENLRVVTAQENNRNTPLRKNNRSGRTGVFWYPRYNRWLAKIAVGGKNKHLGYFDSYDEACVAREAAERELGFHKNHGRKREGGTPS